MNKISDPQLMAERVESLKAGVIGGFSLGLAFVITSLLNTVVLARYFPTLVILHIDFNWLWLCRGALAQPAVGIAGFSGLLFGVTYRYIIRTDKNPQLKTGAVMAFALVRGLTQVEMGLDSSTVLPFVVLAGESILWFAIAAIAVDIAILLGWVKSFPSS